MHPPSQLADPAVAVILLDAVAAGQSDRDACALAGVEPPVLRRTLERDVAFAGAYMAARRRAPAGPSPPFAAAVASPVAPQPVVVPELLPDPPAPDSRTPEPLMHDLVPGSTLAQMDALLPRVDGAHMRSLLGLMWRLANDEEAPSGVRSRCLDWLGRVYLAGIPHAVARELAGEYAGPDAERKQLGARGISADIGEALLTAIAGPPPGE